MHSFTWNLHCKVLQGRNCTRIGNQNWAGQHPPRCDEEKDKDTSVVLTKWLQVH